MNDSNESWLPPGVLARWCKLFPNVSARPSEFYDLLERALEQRKIPKLEISRVFHREGSLLSAKREYLRLRSGRFVVDVCGAPYGTGFFISWWFAEKPIINLLLTLLGLVGLWVLLIIFVQFFGPRLGIGLLALGIAFLAWHTREAIGNFLGDLDMGILKLPVIGRIYFAFFRRITYYRIDTQQMYYEALCGTIYQAVDEFTSAKGVKPLSEAERKPVLKHLYRQAL